MEVVGLIWGLSVMAPLARGTLQPLQGLASQLSLSSLDDASLADIFDVSGRCLPIACASMPGLACASMPGLACAAMPGLAGFASVRCAPPCNNLCA